MALLRGASPYAAIGQMIVSPEKQIEMGETLSQYQGVYSGIGGLTSQIPSVFDTVTESIGEGAAKIVKPLLSEATKLIILLGIILVLIIYFASKSTKLKVNL
jgi:hypothetical protein